MLGEMQLVEGVVRVAGTVAYCDLRPWILNTTIQVIHTSCLALPCLALPCLALPCLALPCLALPCLALSCLALSLSLLCLTLPLPLPHIAIPDFRLFSLPS